jgi:hypothetical protein
MNAKIWRLTALLLSFIFILGCASSGGNGPEPKRLPDEWIYSGYHPDPGK